MFGGDRLRTVLSVTGVSVGIFSTVAIMAVTGSLQKSLRDGLEDFGRNTAIIERIPLEPDLTENGEFRWWEYASRPHVSLDEYLYLKEHCTLASSMTYTICYDSDNLVGVSGGWETSLRNTIAHGRGFTEAELSGCGAVAIVGDSYASAHKGEISLAIDGRRFEIIGTFSKSGINTVSLVDTDESVVVPVRSLMALRNEEPSRTMITANHPDNVSPEEFDASLRSALRLYRRTDPSKGDDFAVNRISFIAGEMEGLFATIRKLGWLIGVFSLLIGGFGIANIMFVSVKERTREIGIKKALGASKIAICKEFLMESAALSTIGGACGIAAAWLFSLLLSGAPVRITLCAEDILLGLTISLIIGIAAGTAPAASAANMNPVRAISSPEGLS